MYDLIVVGFHGMQRASEILSQARELADDRLRPEGRRGHPAGRFGGIRAPQSSDPASLVEHFRGCGGTILRTTLPREVAERVQATLGTDQDHEGSVGGQV